MERGAAELLYRARDRVRVGWCQHAEARAVDGIAVEPWHASAAEWSLLGSIVAAFEDRSASVSGPPLMELALALDALAPYVDDDSLAGWNDDPSQTQDGVVAALNTAAGATSGRLHLPPAQSQN